MRPLTPFSFLHCADLHLDSPFEGIKAVNERVAATLRDATFAALDNIAKLAVDRRVDFVLIAGDVFDGADHSLRAQLCVQEFLARLTDAGIACCVVHGNHDPLDAWQLRLAWPQGVSRFESDAVERVTMRRGDVPLADVYGVSFPTRDVKENLARRFRIQGEAPFAIGLLHANVGGREDHANYAPCTLEDLAAAGMNYWALGHIHQPAVLREQKPTVVYAGAPQGRSVKDAGPRGCYVVHVHENGVVEPEFVATDVIRWFVRELDIAGLADLDALVGRLCEERETIRSEAEGRAAVARMKLVGRGPVHHELIAGEGADRQCEDLLERMHAEEAGRDDFVWFESLTAHTRPDIDLAARRQADDFIGDFLRATEAMQKAADPAATLLELAMSRPESGRENGPVANRLRRWTHEDWSEALADAEALGVELLTDGRED